MTPVAAATASCAARLLVYPSKHATSMPFDGFDDHVDLGELGSFPQTGFTLSAWVSVNMSTTAVWSACGSTGCGPMLWSAAFAPVG
jgi:hypothetical protein